MCKLNAPISQYNSDFPAYQMMELKEFSVNDIDAFLEFGARNNWLNWRQGALPLAPHIFNNILCVWLMSWQRVTQMS